MKIVRNRSYKPLLSIGRDGILLITSKWIIATGRRSSMRFA